MAVASYPFPARNSKYPNDSDLVYTDGLSAGDPRYRTLYERSQGDHARFCRLQYLGIEEELERSFRFVFPSDENADAYSLKFAEIIRSASNAYEVHAKHLYCEFYGEYDLNVFNYLALDVHLQLSEQRVTQLAAIGSFQNHPEVERPFHLLAKWDRASCVQAEHVPKWWTAYNKIKHSNDGVKSHGSLANSMGATAALFLLIERMFGFGVLQGGFYKDPEPPISVIRNHPRWARLFVRT